MALFEKSRLEITEKNNNVNILIPKKFRNKNNNNQMNVTWENFSS